MILPPESFGVFLRQLAGSLAAVFVIGCGQLKTEAPFADLEGQTAVSVIVDQSALGGIFPGVLGESVFECGVVGADFDHTVCFIKIDVGCFLVSPVFIKPPVIFKILSALEPGKWDNFRTEKVRTTYASSALT